MLITSVRDNENNRRKRNAKKNNKQTNKQRLKRTNGKEDIAKG